MRVERGERRRSERKDVNPFLVSLQPISSFLLIAGVLLSAGELPTLSPSLSHPLSNVPVTFSTSRSFLFPTFSPRFCSLYQVAFVPLASPFLAHLFHLLYAFTGLLLSLANSHSPPFAFLFSLLDEGRTKITNPRGICREPQLDRGVSPGRALAPAVTFQPQRKCLTLALSVTKLRRPDFSSILNFSSIFSRILDLQLYQPPIRIIGSRMSHENLVSITFVQRYRVKFVASL